MHEVRVHQIGTERPNLMRDRTVGTRIGIASDGGGDHVDPGITGRLQEAPLILSGREHHHPDLVPGRGQSGQQREEVALGPADPFHLLDVEEPHGSA